MLVQIKKGKNGKNTIRCVRDDGTEDWCYVTALMDHDLAHLVVEKELAFTNGLYGHINRGVTFQMLASAGVTQAHSWHPEIFWSEFIVNYLSQRLLLPEVKLEMNEAIRKGCEQIGLLSFPPPLCEEQITRTIALIKQIWIDWEHCEPGQSLEIHFTH